MGWKASCLFANNREEGYLGSLPGHDHQRARQLIEQLEIGEFRSVDMSTFERGIYPDSNQLYLGAYDGAAIIGSHKITDRCFSGEVPDEVKRLTSAIPGARILAITLHSVVNLFGYAYYENGTLVRLRAGSANDGVFADYGEVLPEEERLFQQSVIRNGTRVFLEDTDGVQEELPEDAFGEEFVFELSRRFFDYRINERHDVWNLQMERLTPIEPKSWFRRLLGM